MLSSEVVLSGDDTVKATNGNYSRILATNRVQEDRKRYLKHIMELIQIIKNTYASIYDAVCKETGLSARARNYASSVESYLKEITFL